MKLRPLAQWFISNTASLAPRLYGFLVFHHHLGGFYPALLPHMRSPYMPYICSVIIFDLILTETRPPWKVLGLPSGGRWLWCLDGQQHGETLIQGGLHHHSHHCHAHHDDHHNLKEPHDIRGLLIWPMQRLLAWNRFWRRWTFGCHQGGLMTIENQDGDGIIFHNEYFGLPAKYDRYNSRVSTTLWVWLGKTVSTMEVTVWDAHSILSCWLQNRNIMKRWTESS